IKALSHLNDTSDYAVRFERGVEVTYGDRTHYYISGTASISNKGEILFPCDVARQTDRVLENIDALLKSSGSRFEEMAYLIVYIRDMSDFSVVEQRLSEKLVKVPYIILHASVCRPGWLVEMEGIAISSKCGAGFPRF
ncbi:MAG: Rid family hydrolase, partial [Rhodospirillaceae bacterium]